MGSGFLTLAAPGGIALAYSEGIGTLTAACSCGWTQWTNTGYSPGQPPEREDALLDTAAEEMRAEITHHLTECPGGPLMPYQPRRGDRIRITRYRPDGRIHFVKTGTVLHIAPPTGSRRWPLYEFKDDSGPRVHLLGAEEYAKQCPGWTQKFEPERRG